MAYRIQIRGCEIACDSIEELAHLVEEWGIPTRAVVVAPPEQRVTVPPPPKVAPAKRKSSGLGRASLDERVAAIVGVLSERKPGDAPGMSCGLIAQRLGQTESTIKNVCGKEARGKGRIVRVKFGLYGLPPSR